MQEPTTDPLHKRDLGLFEYLLREDPQVKCTVAIWAAAVLGLALSIPLVSITETGPIIPGGVMFAAFLATADVNERGRKKLMRKDQATLEETRRRVAELEERLASVETISRFEQHLAEKALPVQEGMRDEG